MVNHPLCFAKAESFWEKSNMLYSYDVGVPSVYHEYHWFKNNLFWACDRVDQSYVGKIKVNTGRKKEESREKPGSCRQRHTCQ